MRLLRLFSVPIVLGLLLSGVWTAPVHAEAAEQCFPETGFCVQGRFFEYWQANGGLARNGFPLTGVPIEVLEDGNAYTVQYFERARFEHHPEHDGTPYEVLLGQFGRQILAENDALAGDPAFQLLYLTNPDMQGLLGFVTGMVRVAPGAYLPFERGFMLYEGGEARRIYVFCQNGQLRRALGPTLDTPYFPDTYGPGDPPGGGPGPQPGLHEPRLGFGKLWRQHQAVRDCLGYATSPEESAYTIRRLAFSRGNLLSAMTPAGAFIYMQYATSGGYLYEGFPDIR